MDSESFAIPNSGVPQYGYRSLVIAKWINEYGLCNHHSIQIQEDHSHRALQSRSPSSTRVALLTPHISKVM